MMRLVAFIGLIFISNAAPCLAQQGQEWDAVGSLSAPAVKVVQWSSDGKQLIALAPQEIWTWDTSDGRLLTHIITEKPFLFAAMSPDEKTIATAQGNSFSFDLGGSVRGITNVILWDANSGRQISEFPMPCPATSFQYTPDGKDFLVTCARDAESQNGSVQLFDVITHEGIHTFNDNSYPPTVAQISSDGQHLVALCGGVSSTLVHPNVRKTVGEVDIWNLKSGVLESQTQVNDGSSRAVISRNGNVIVFMSGTSESRTENSSIDVNGLTWCSIDWKNGGAVSTDAHIDFQWTFQQQFLFGDLWQVLGCVSNEGMTFFGSSAMIQGGAFDLLKATPNPNLYGGNGTLLCKCISPDEKWVAAAVGGGVVCLWKMPQAGK